MGFLSNIISATVKTVITPVSILKDVANIATGEEADATKKHIEQGLATEESKEGNDLADHYATKGI